MCKPIIKQKEKRFNKQKLQKRINLLLHVGIKPLINSTLEWPKKFCVLLIASIWRFCGWYTTQEGNWKGSTSFPDCRNKNQTQTQDHWRFNSQLSIHYWELVGLRLNKRARWSVRREVSQFDSQSTSQLFGQYVRQLTSRLVGQSVRQSNSRLVGHLVRHFGLSVRQPISWLFGQSVRQLTSRLIGQSARKPIVWLVGRSVRQSVSRSLNEVFNR